MPEAICAWTDVREAGDHFRDIGNAIGNFCCGVGNAVKDFVTGIAGLLGGLLKIMAYAGYCSLPVQPVPMPEQLDEDIHKMADTFVQIIKDPGNVLESIGQGMFDTADEKGIAYSSGYVVADVVIAVLTDKGLDKLKDAGKAGKVLEIGSNTINPNDIRFSQSSVNGSAEIVESIRNNGWVGDPIDVVQIARWWFDNNR